jgi:hypothetical protein
VLVEQLLQRFLHAELRELAERAHVADRSREGVHAHQRCPRARFAEGADHQRPLARPVDEALHPRASLALLDDDHVDVRARHQLDFLLDPPLARRLRGSQRRVTPWWILARMA